MSYSALQRLSVYLSTGLNGLIRIIKRTRRQTLELSASVPYVVVGMRPVLYSEGQVGVGSQ